MKGIYRDTIDYCRSLNVGDKIKFTIEKQRYTVKAKSERYIICTKPFNIRHTCFYCIIDLDRLVRGPNDLVFSHFDFMTQKGIDDCLEWLLLGETEVSSSHSIQLDVEKPKEGY